MWYPCCGSPPRPWGQWYSKGRMSKHERFTPTPVGTMKQEPVRLKTETVHPHARGDNSMLSGIWERHWGSPPRPWGQSEQAGTQHQTARFTPTPVGTISPESAAIDLATVHPHARGDNGRHAGAVAMPSGSPPRPWGQFPPQQWIGYFLRFTPTPVGTISS